MQPRRKEPSDKNKEIDSMPELEELPTTDEDQQEISVQGMVDRIEGQSHGHTMAKQPAELQGDVPEKNVVDMEEAGSSTNYGNFQHKEPEQGAGSSRAGESRRSIPTPLSQEERYTPPHRREETGFPEKSCNYQRKWKW
ncbi:ubiquitin-like [Dorcoceras hygrometricum]|uniref:Ubiquitin-like n=1 Tax=Dorcoceras hygrometricum TaxID=472368 RepID=A0A2Z7CLQ9_9LAMI|nr:ubiquitin-like [Dorcoceras hygrometricum]